MKCPKCGLREPMDIFCEECYAEEYPMLKGFKDLELKTCILCGSFLMKGNWSRQPSLAQAVSILVPGKLKFNSTVGKPELKIQVMLPVHSKGPGVQVNGSVEVRVSGKMHERQKNNAVETYALPFTFDYTICTDCSRGGTKYFEGILQLRNATGEAQAFVLGSVKAADGVFITDTKEHRQGMDYYLTSTKFMLDLGKRLFLQFGGDIRITRKLFSRSKQTQKNIYRTTLLITLPEVKKGDVVSIHNKLIVVDSIRANKLYGVDLKTGLPTHADYKSGICEVVAHAADVKEAVVSKSHPHIEVIHPETYQSVAVENTRKVISGDSVLVMLIEGKVYIVH